MQTFRQRLRNSPYLMFAIGLALPPLFVFVVVAVAGLRLSC